MNERWGGRGCHSGWGSDGSMMSRRRSCQVLLWGGAHWDAKAGGQSRGGAAQHKLARVPVWVRRLRVLHLQLPEQRAGAEEGGDHGADVHTGALLADGEAR
jgi:hypothetical protein